MLYGERRFFPTPGAACHAEGAPGRCRSWPLSSSSLAGLASLGGESGGSGSLALFFLFPPWGLAAAGGTHSTLCLPVVRFEGPAPFQQRLRQMREPI